VQNYFAAIKKSLGLFFLGVIANCAHAQLVFTVATTANATGHGYTAGQVATFAFTVSGANLSANVGNQFFNGITNQWWDDITSDTPVFTAIGGTGLTGTFARATANANDPFAYVQALPPSPSQLTLNDGAETSNIGLLVGATGVNYIVAGNLDWGASFPATGNYSSLTSYFTPYIGTHALSGGYLDISLVGGSLISFTATSLTISAVPEPSTYTVFAGLAVLGFGVMRRRTGTSANSPARG
jgi:hypothetical protein